MDPEPPVATLAGPAACFAELYVRRVSVWMVLALIFTSITITARMMMHIAAATKATDKYMYRKSCAVEPHLEEEPASELRSNAKFVR